MSSPLFQYFLSVASYHLSTLQSTLPLSLLLSHAEATLPSPACLPHPLILFSKLNRRRVTASALQEEAPLQPRKHQNLPVSARVREEVLEDTVPQSLHLVLWKML